MITFEYFSAIIGSCIIIILIAADYLQKYNTDIFQRKLLFIMLSSVFISAICDFIGSSLGGRTEIHADNELYYVWSIYFIARNCCFYYGAVFIDYFAHENIIRTKRFIRIVTVFLALYTLSIIPNFQLGYYFHILKDNTYIRGILFFIQIIISYFPIIIILIDIIMAYKYIKHNQILMITIFVVITSVGAAVDIILGTTKLIWPCVTASILYVYFFMLRYDLKVDSLTGMGNRNDFYKYINKFYLDSRNFKQKNKNEYAFIKININKLGEINDIHGHLEGDNAVRDIATIIKTYFRHTDFAVRYGGDEFILITTAKNDVQRIIGRINNAVDNQNKKNIRPYKLHISYSYDIYKVNSGIQIQDFLAQLDGKNKSTEIKTE
jgi:diguanylate cyclase (GGDEF)-like protein